nr:hypothetical protein [Tanacetum cinerariifolium]
MSAIILVGLGELMVILGEVMDPNSSHGEIFLGEDVVVILSDKVEGSGDWNSLEFQDTANSGKKRETKCMAYDGKINLGVEENMILNEYAVKLCLEHKVKRGNKVVKKELIVALRGKIYFVKFIINLEEDDVEPGVIFGRSFLRMTKAIIDFEVGTITIYPDIDPFLKETEEKEKSNDDWDHLLDFNIDDVPLLGEEGLSLFVCRMGKSSRNKKREMENLNFFYQVIGTSSSAGGHLTQEAAAKEAIAIIMSRKFALLPEERPIIETIAYHDKHKKILDEVWKDKVELDGNIVKEEEDAVKRIKDSGSDINTMPYRIYELRREDMKKVDRGITMINHTQAEAMGILINVLGQVGVTTLIAKSDVMRNTESDSDDEEDYQIKRNKFGVPIYETKPAPYLNCNDPAGRSLVIETKPDYKGSYTKEEEATGQWRTEIREVWEHTMMRPNHQDPNALDNMKPWKRYCFHKFTRSSCYGNDVTEMQSLGCDGEIDDMFRIRLWEARSDEEIFTLVAWIRAFNINEPIYAELYHEFYSTYKFDEVCADDELQTKKIIKFRLGGRAHSLTLLEFARRLGLYKTVELEEEGFNVYFEGGLRSDEHFNAHDYWLSISHEENLGLSRSHTSTIGNPILRVIHKMITYSLCQRTNGLGDCKMDEEEMSWNSKKESDLLDLDTITLRDLIDYDGKLIQEDPQPGVPRVGIPRPPRASMQDLYDRMGRMEICQEAIERMEIWIISQLLFLDKDASLDLEAIDSVVRVLSHYKQFSRRRAEAYDLQQSYRCTKVGRRTDSMVKVSSSSVRLLEGVGPSVGDVGKLTCSLLLDVSSLGGWVPDVAITCLLASLMRSESKKNRQVKRDASSVTKIGIILCTKTKHAKPQNLGTENLKVRSTRLEKCKKVYGALSYGVINDDEEYNLGNEFNGQKGVMGKVLTRTLNEKKNGIADDEETKLNQLWMQAMIAKSTSLDNKLTLIPIKIGEDRIKVVIFEYEIVKEVEADKGLPGKIEIVCKNGDKVVIGKRKKVAKNDEQNSRADMHKEGAIGNNVMYKPKGKEKLTNESSNVEGKLRNDESRESMGEKGSPSNKCKNGWAVQKDVIKSTRRTANKLSVLMDEPDRKGFVTNENELLDEDSDVYEEMSRSPGKIAQNELHCNFANVLNGSGGRGNDTFN